MEIIDSALKPYDIYSSSWNHYF